MFKLATFVFNVANVKLEPPLMMGDVGIHLGPQSYWDLAVCISKFYRKELFKIIKRHM